MAILLSKNEFFLMINFDDVQPSEMTLRKTGVRNLKMLEKQINN